MLLLFLLYGVWCLHAGVESSSVHCVLNMSITIEMHMNVRFSKPLRKDIKFHTAHVMTIKFSYKASTISLLYQCLTSCQIVE